MKVFCGVASTRVWPTLAPTEARRRVSLPCAKCRAAGEVGDGDCAAEQQQASSVSATRDRPDAGVRS